MTATPTTLLLVAALAFKLLVVGWALDRGFEIGDEGYFLLNLNHPENAPEAFQVYNLLTLFGPPAHFGVKDARLLRVGLELLASVALIGGVWAWGRARIFAPGSVGLLPFVLFSLLGVLLTNGSRSAGYNDFTNLSVYGTTGALFFLLALPVDASARRRRALAAFGAGAAAGLQMGVKFTSGLLLLALVAATWVILMRELRVRERLRLAAWLLAGMGLLGVLFVIAGGGFAAVAADVALLPTFSKLTGYRPAYLVVRLAKGELVTLVQLVALGIAFAIAWLGLSRARGLGADSRLALALAAVAALLGVHVRALHPFFIAPSLLYLSVFLLFLVALAVGLHGRLGTRVGLAGDSAPLARLAPLLLLLAAPLVAMAGTNVPVTMRLPSHTLPWVLAIAVPLCELRGRAGLVRFHGVAAIALALATSTIVYQHQLVRAYGLPRPVADQIHPVKGLAGLRVDADTRDFLERLAAQMDRAGYRAGDPIFALDYMPGLVFYLGGVSPGWNFHMLGKPELNCFNIERARYEGRPFLLLGRPMSRAQRECLRSLDLADGYRLVDTIPFPYQHVYASFDAPGMTHLLVYAPREGARAP